jgi:NADH:ubiquinone oxidoreductase subunit 5 (subunit L)/multisubunit Na+/H+ antiporter MnhA subunit
MYSAAIAAEGVEGPDPHEAHHEEGHGAGARHGADHHAGAHLAAHHAQAHDHGAAGHGAAHAHEPHEDPLSRNPMTIALCVLTLFAIPGAAWLLEHGYTSLVTAESMYGSVGEWVAAGLPEGIAHHDSQVAHDAHLRALILSLIVASAGILAAWYLYVLRRDLPARITARLGEVYVAVRRKYYVDEAVDATAVRGTLGLAGLQRWFDEKVVDGVVNLFGWTGKQLGFFAAGFDRVVVDGAVNLVGSLTQTFGSVARLLQTGRVQQYVSFAVAGGLAAAAWLILS